MAGIAALRFAGVSQQLLDKFSQRSRQRDAAIKVFVDRQWGVSRQTTRSPFWFGETRANKLTEISTEEVRNRQRDRLSHKKR